MITKSEARFQSNSVCLVWRYFVPCTSVASLRTHLPSNHSYCYAFQSRRALRNTTDAPESKILVRNADQPAFLTRPLHNPGNRMIIKSEARFQLNTVCLVGRYFVPCTSVASLRTHLPSNHSYCYAFQSRRALRNTTDAPESEILVRNAG